MPKLKEYVASSDKDGSYLVANVGGAHPVTLQLTQVGANLLGYSVGDGVPTKLVWSLYDVGLAYTENSTGNVAGADTENLNTLQAVTMSSSLTQKERERLIKILAKYSGPNERQVTELLDDLRQDQSSSKGTSEHSKNTEDDSGDSAIGAGVSSIDSVVNSTSDK
jgi:hypothetical protein